MVNDIKKHMKLQKTKPSELTAKEVSKTPESRQKTMQGRKKVKNGERVSFYIEKNCMELIRNLSAAKKQSQNTVLEDLIEFARSKGYFNMLEEAGAIKWLK